ncbi:hypothetical protein H310_14764 [Aphanomyces invadans]|uniref:DDE Tnp4 domain-containing protein n=1 Tax=Aphanomyces invadans TaxID=157072 RepID=A0A024T8K1_9STRA|nr:hypothetical protein H310_14764 [Aphanomyces invadans]ETV90440.1 hypothetical protein H310_14764 [Aphanomyces invadans]|eukprot:XP_008880914.1 hypothetical protein H310_14764 [Aphanomyces invadans]
MAMTVLKHYSSWDKNAADFGFKPPTFENLVMRALAVVEPVLYERFIVCQSMSSLVQSGHRFSNYQYASYAVDVKFQPSLRPMGRFAEQKRYFSGKQGLYGYKIEAAVSPDGRCVAMSCSLPGSVHDFTILHSQQAIHKAMPEKTPDESLRPDDGELSTQYPESWVCLVDMTYIGIGHVLRRIHPKRRPANGMLDADDLERNERISSDRVVVENFFGRVCALWKISYATFSWSEKNYYVIQRTAFSLTNFHLSLMPLRSEDETFYAYVMARYERMATEKKRKRAESQRRYRLNRQERLALDHNRAGRLRFS